MKLALPRSVALAGHDIGLDETRREEQDRGAPIEGGKGKERKGRLGRGKKRAVIENRSKIRDAAFLSNLPAESWSWNDKVVGVALATMAEGEEGGAWQ